MEPTLQSYKNNDLRVQPQCQRGSWNSGNATIVGTHKRALVECQQIAAADSGGIVFCWSEPQCRNVRMRSGVWWPICNVHGVELCWLFKLF